MPAYNGQNGPQNNNQQPQKQPTIGGVIFKVALGLMFIVIGFDDLDDFSGLFISIIIGAALIAWGLIPYIQMKKAAEEAKTEQILSKPIEEVKFKDEAERLAEKYEDLK